MGDVSPSPVRHGDALYYVEVSYGGNAWLSGRFGGGLPHTYRFSLAEAERYVASQRRLGSPYGFRIIPA